MPLKLRRRPGLKPLERAGRPEENSMAAAFRFKSAALVVGFAAAKGEALAAELGASKPVRPRKTSVLLLVSPGAKLAASEEKAMKRPSALIAVSWLLLLPALPSNATET